MSKLVTVKVRFEGEVTVNIGSDVLSKSVESEVRSKIEKQIAEDVALADIVATSDSPDSPRLQAFDSCLEDCKDISEKIKEDDLEDAFDSTEVVGISGSWSIAS